MLSCGADARVAAVGEGLVELTGVAPFLRQSYGGDTLNTAIYLARCLSGRGAGVDYVSALGTDVLSDELLAAWREEGLGVEHVARIEGRLPGIYRVLLDEAGNRSFLYWRAQSAARQLFHEQTAAQWAAPFAQHRLMYFSGITLAILDPAARERCLEAMRLLRRQDVIIAFDSNYRPALWEHEDMARAAMTEALRASDIALVSFEDEHNLWNDASPRDALNRIAAHGGSEIVVKNGAQPCLIRAGEQSHEVASYAVAAQLDTTAAGDSFNAGYLAARLGGHDVVDAVGQAHLLAAAVIQHPGAIVPRAATDAVLAGLSLGHHRR